MLVDSNVLIDLIGIPFESQNREEVAKELQTLTDEHVELRIPIAAVLETGRHVQMIVDGHSRRECARRLNAILFAITAQQAPWRFSAVEWDVEFVESLLAGPYGNLKLPESLATSFLEMGDMTIMTELRRLRANFDLSVVQVGVWTRDQQLSALIAEL